MIPTHLLPPADQESRIADWIEVATHCRNPGGTDAQALEQFYQLKNRVREVISELRADIRNYNLPFLSLPASTDKSVALDVFIKMNTNSKPLTQFDVIVAEVESVMGESLHDLEDQLADADPRIERYGELSDLILSTAALLQGHPPTQKGAWDMDKRVLVEQWATPY